MDGAGTVSAITYSSLLWSVSLTDPWFQYEPSADVDSSDFLTAPREVYRAFG
jgi:hypothetical protein